MNWLAVIVIWPTRNHSDCGRLKCTNEEATIVTQLKRIASSSVTSQVPYSVPKYQKWKLNQGRGGQNRDLETVGGTGKGLETGTGTGIDHS